jgi:superfamily II DNA/RNA helicase
VLKSDCLNLPPQSFEKRRVTMTAAQGQAYNDMQQTFIVENEEAGKVEAKIVLEQMLRLQQITGGYLPQTESDTGEVVALMEPKNNPKFKEIIHLLEEGGDQRMLVWSRFTHEVLAITELLNEAGFPAMPFYGGLNDKEKISVRKSFQRDETYRVVVGNPAAGGLGIDEFKVASLVCYVTNSFDTEKRVQSEDRTHRIGSEMHRETGITYYDIIIPATIDIKVMQIMRNNVKISTAVMGDKWKDWI